MLWAVLYKTLIYYILFNYIFLINLYIRNDTFQLTIISSSFRKSNLIVKYTAERRLLLTGKTDEHGQSKTREEGNEYHDKLSLVHRIQAHLHGSALLIIRICVKNDREKSNVERILRYADITIMRIMTDWSENLYSQFLATSIETMKRSLRSTLI